MQRSLITGFDVSPRSTSQVHHHVRKLAGSITKTNSRIPRDARSLLSAVGRAFTRVIRPSTNARTSRTTSKQRPSHRPNHGHRGTCSHGHHHCSFCITNPFFGPRRITSVRHLRRILSARNGAVFEPQFTDSVTRINPTNYFSSSIGNVYASGTIVTGLVSRSSNAVFRVKFTRSLNVPICTCHRNLHSNSDVGLVVTRSIHTIFSSSSSLTQCLRAKRRGSTSCTRF